MLKIICTPEVKEQLINESRYLEYEVADIDSDKANTLMHLYAMPDDAWIIPKNVPKNKNLKI